MREAVARAAAVAPPFRLPDSVRPLHYTIEVEPDVAKNEIHGKAVIQVAIWKATRHIVLHALRLQVTHAAVNPAEGAAAVIAIHNQPENETIYLELDTTLPTNSLATVTMKYVGEMSPPGSMSGLCPTPYQGPGGAVKFGFETMMEPISARSVFPCWDEPEIKAHFTVCIVADVDLTCLSNMELDSERLIKRTQGEPKKRAIFKASPLMSTYLVVMIAGHLNVLQSNDFRIPIRVWAPLDRKIENGAYALDIAVKAMKTHESNYGLEYPLAKLDMVAIPGHTGGMEHWGCVSYEERGLLLDDSPSEADKMRLAFLVTHELAHQWFGNIVTMRWWDSIWLNEAFADWATVNALSQMIPNFDSRASFLASPDDGGRAGFQDALELDSSMGSHAIQDPRLSPAAAFDSIAYLKGCSILRMVAEDLGVDIFLKGIQRYLHKHIYLTATTEDLWIALSEISGKDVAELMATWTQTVGYPLLTVNELRPTGKVAINQSRFLQNGDTDFGVGPYPLTVQIRGPNGIEKHTMRGQEMVVPVNLFSYKLNANLVGFYRVSYPLSRIHKFAVQFAGNTLSSEDKVGIISDLGALVLTGSADRRCRVSHFLDFLLTVKDTTSNLYVWREILGQFRRVEAAFMFENKEIVDTLKLVRSKLLNDLVEKGYLDFSPDDTTEDILLRTLLFGELRNHYLVQERSCVAWKRFINGEQEALNPNLRKAIFKTVVALDNSKDTWDKLKSIALERSYIRAEDPVTPLEALSALGSSPDPELIARALQLITPSSSTYLGISDLEELVLSKNPVPFVMNWALRQSILKSLSEHPGGAIASWNWLMNNWNILVDKRRKDSVNGFGFITTVLGGLATSEHLAQVENFFSDRVDESFDLVLAQAIDKIRARCRFIAADRANLLKFAS
ncbi:hypothetical protein JX265_003783 [Neoarthrinium moseri]|uniref:Aminopeptidase n=1 Tax=Neoarthrinium moseri TaxID=1658444 RepID=A0A9Q0ASJ4_9PEZI|nr:hypothetical protein JX265_003783 [Neoarthrinium moseri]